MAITDGGSRPDWMTGSLAAREMKLNEVKTQEGESKPPVHESVKPEGCWWKKLLSKIKSPERA